MTTIKSYTDIEQSKKLAEILPLESANMWWTALNWQETEYYVEVKQDGINQPKKAIPCWSLSALLDILPNYQLQTQDDGIGILCSYNGKLNIVTADNPIDACYEIILKLHELNLL